MRRRTALLLSAVVALSCPAVGLAEKPVGPLYSLSTLSTLRISVNRIDTEPIDGFIPQIVIGLTDQQSGDNAYGGIEGFGISSPSPGGNSLPFNLSAQNPYTLPAQYAIATLDSGSSGDVISYDSAQQFDLADAGLQGSKTTTISGASGNETVAITNALGTYASDFSNTTVVGGALSVKSPAAMQGQYNVPVLEGNQGDGLPNAIGSPILAQYRVTIANSQPQHVTVGGLVYQTPTVTLGAFSSTVPAGYSMLTLKTADALTGRAEGEKAPYYLNTGLTGPTNPDTPGVWASLFTSGGVGISRNGFSAANQAFLLDTGAQVSVISTAEAAEVGILKPSLATADFTEQAQGVGGITEVPGYYLDALTLVTQAGVLSWNRVPVIVLDVADPRSPSSSLPGILGTDLFSDRDLILNTNVGTKAQTYLAIGPQMQWQNSSGGNWSNASNWAVVLPNGIDMQANFYGSITAPATINVDAAYTVGRITFDNAKSYTLGGPGSITMDDSADGAQINVRTGSHTIATPLILASDTTVTVIPATSTLTVSGVVSSSGGPFGITECGFGTLLLTNANTYSGATNVSTGTLTITRNRQRGRSWAGIEKSRSDARQQGRFDTNFKR
jgi:autotransporter-associated beta strand protein